MMQQQARLIMLFKDKVSRLNLTIRVNGVLRSRDLSNSQTMDPLKNVLLKHILNCRKIGVLLLWQISGIYLLKTIAGL